MSNPTNASCSIVLLSAGRGSRMASLTDRIPKSLLQVGDKLVLDWLLDPILARTTGELVVVAGHGAEHVKQHLTHRYGSRIATVLNERYEQDVNILSVETGVAALEHPERGYLIVETDLLVDERVWDCVFSAIPQQDSFWVCQGVYGPRLTGGIVHARTDGHIDVIDYRPEYDPRFDGWPKMLGLLYVGPGQVTEDRRLRQAAIERSLAQYYLVPWQQGLQTLPCRVLQLPSYFARSFNTAADFHSASAAFLSGPAARHDKLFATASNGT